MLERLRNKPFLTAVAVASTAVLLVVALLPIARLLSQSHTSTPAQAQSNTTTGAHPKTLRNLPSSPSVSVKWFDSTARVSWKAILGATAYQLTLIRLSDMAIMQQKKVPASQLAWDAQGIWPDKQYHIAVQSVLQGGALGKAEYSPAGQAAPISRARYNGFLDTMNLPAGQIDTDLWNEHIFYSNVPMRGTTFINNQLHGHIAAGCSSGTPCAGQQTITTQNARVPFDFAGGRTLTIHGEVDLKGDQHQWFGASLSPQILGPDRVLDQVDRFYMAVRMPQLELFSFQGRTSLLYAAGDGSQPQALASVPNPTNLNNVRDEIVWQVSATHTTVRLNGQPTFDLNWPAPLSFSHGYLSLFAEDYPNSGGMNGQPQCDQFPNDCAIWHLDNWGFDAPAGKNQPRSRAYYSIDCGPYSSSPDQGVSAGDCDARTTNDTGSSLTYTVNVASTANLTSARVAFDAQRLADQGAITVSVNGSAKVDIPYIATDRNPYDYQSYTVQIPASLLHAGSNTVTFRQEARNSAGAITIANVQIETLASNPYSPPPLPPEPAPIGTWTQG